jgi:hypothetical protein
MVILLALLMRSGWRESELFGAKKLTPATKSIAQPSLSMTSG